jgi:sugar lactone lactonase YvrE
MAHWGDRTNGLAFDAQGRVFGCCQGGRRMLRFDPDGKNVVIADRVGWAMYP